MQNLNSHYNFKDEDFKIKDDSLYYYGLNLEKIVQEYGSPLKITYLPKISENIDKCITYFNESTLKHRYKGNYYYTYCTKSSHFKHILDEVLKNDVHLETSSSFDLDIINNLKENGKINDNTIVLCNGFKRGSYISKIAQFIKSGHDKCLPIIDDKRELSLLKEQITDNFNIGLRVATEEDPKFEFYTSRLGINCNEILDFYLKNIANSNAKLKMVHFFINTGINDTAYYWNELNKCLNLYIALKKICPSLDSFNIGGGFPIKTSLDFDYDYKNVIDLIVSHIKKECNSSGIDEPNIFTEFGSYTVGEASANIYNVLEQKQQNDKEKWNMIDSSFITTLPDTWAINKNFITLPLNRLSDNHEKVLLGGITCDSDDFYTSKQHKRNIQLPIYDKTKPLYVGFFNTGAYQDNISGYGGVKHCLVPSPKHIVIENVNGLLEIDVFREQQTENEMLKILGYE